MTLEQAFEMAALERDMAQLERALKNPNLAASSQGTEQNRAALERIAQKRMRLAEIKGAALP
jgi:hypothetical protein